jgi:phosphatidylserine/phosphatidylglycerophosphate/cardiolipin synthase-like enzyme
MLHEVPTRDLELLLEGLERGSIVVPVTKLKLQSLGFDELARSAANLSTLDGAALSLLIRAVLAERADDPELPELVWTGPEGMSASSRRTEVVFRDLLGSAERDVWMAGYAIDHGASLFAPLHRAMVERQVSARFLLNLQYDPNEQRQTTEEAGAAFLVHRFLERQWPFEGPQPAIFYDPRTLQKKSYASMHAKVVVVDETHVLIGSANFTERGQQRNIEAGALIHDAAFARQLVTQLQSLIDGGYVKRYPPR